MKIVTYATHSEGLFDTLMNSGYPIDVMGWGTKWGGFMDKFKGIVEYLEKQQDDEIIIFVDGFDSKINKSLENVEQDFKDMNCKVLVSMDDRKLPIHVLSSYLLKRVFGSCKDGYTCNTGLYMGYCKELKMVIQHIISQDGDDDQRSFNSVCSDFSFIKVDTQHKIFENFTYTDSTSNAYFVQFPGKMSWKRWTRAIAEYSKYLIPEICILVLLLVVYLYRNQIFFKS
jgi:hypothetical protein